MPFELSVNSFTGIFVIMAVCGKNGRGGLATRLSLLPRAEIVVIYSVTAPMPVIPVKARLSRLDKGYPLSRYTISEALIHPSSSSLIL